jgi:hypothetical protein
LLLSIAPGARAQTNNELGLLLGAKRTSGNFVLNGSEVEIGSGMTLQATYARRVTRGSVGALYVEFPFLATPSTDIVSNNRSMARNFASLFVGAGPRIKFNPDGILSPWGTAGGRLCAV